MPKKEIKLKFEDFLKTKRDLIRLKGIRGVMNYLSNILDATINRYVQLNKKASSILSKEETTKMIFLL